MKRQAIRICFLILALVAAATSLPATAQFVTVGDPGNPNDQDYGYGTGFGAVATTYAIGTYEVTLNQYTAFLNAVAATDTYELYNPSMATDLNIAGISRRGSSGSYTYSVIGIGARPVAYVSFYDAMRYANWLGTGSTEIGAYTLLGGTPVPSNGLTVTRNPGATVWIPSENEWYKAAYYQPTAEGGDADGYWLYPTGSNAIPNSRPGNASDANSANLNRDDGIDNGFNGGYALTNSTSYSASQNYLTRVGAYREADSYYGTFDQGGNVWEWNDTIIGSFRGRRGTSALFNEYGLRASSRYSVDPSSGEGFIGFRIATIPEPTVSVSLLLAGGLLLARRKRPSAL